MNKLQMARIVFDEIDEYKNRVRVLEDKVSFLLTKVETLDYRVDRVEEGFEKM